MVFTSRLSLPPDNDWHAEVIPCSFSDASPLSWDLSSDASVDVGCRERIVGPQSKTKDPGSFSRVISGADRKFLCFSRLVLLRSALVNLELHREPKELQKIFFAHPGKTCPASFSNSRAAMVISGNHAMGRAARRMHEINEVINIKFQLSRLSGTPNGSTKRLKSSINIFEIKILRKISPAIWFLSSLPSTHYADASVQHIQPNKPMIPSRTLNLKVAS